MNQRGHPNYFMGNQQVAPSLFDQSEIMAHPGGRREDLGESFGDIW